MTHFINPADAHAAPGGRIALYSDAGFSECALTDASPGIADVFVVHKITGEQVVGVLFSLAQSAGFSGTWLEDIIPAGMSHNGTSQSGIGVGYGSCRMGDLLVLHGRYQAQGTSSSCSFVEAIPYPGFSWIITTTCGFGDELPVDKGRLLVNADQTCPCMTVATQPSTWGRIKAMYRN